MQIRYFVLEVLILLLGHAKVSILFCNPIFELNLTICFKGDSGGGLAVSFDETWTLIGIVSAGRVKSKLTPKETCNLPDYVLYTDVGKFHNWINRVVMETHREAKSSDTSAAKNYFPAKIFRIQIFCMTLFYVLRRWI
jgi:hypothetical protein